MGDDAEYEIERQEEERRQAEMEYASRFDNVPYPKGNFVYIRNPAPQPQGKSRAAGGKK